jgi:hypothetical protein
MNAETLQLITVSLVSLLNIGLLIYQTLKKVPKEAEKMQAEREDILGDAAESNLNAAITSNTLLQDRIKELRRDKRDAWAYIAQLKRVMVENSMTIPDYVPSESDPKIK